MPKTVKYKGLVAYVAIFRCPECNRACASAVNQGEMTQAELKGDLRFWVQCLCGWSAQLPGAQAEGGDIRQVPWTHEIYLCPDKPDTEQK